MAGPICTDCKKKKKNNGVAVAAENYPLETDTDENNVIGLAQRRTASSKKTQIYKIIRHIKLYGTYIKH